MDELNAFLKSSGIGPITRTSNGIRVLGVELDCSALPKIRDFLYKNPKASEEDLKAVLGFFTR